jgi:hypothetical protein
VGSGVATDSGGGMGLGDWGQSLGGREWMKSSIGGGAGTGLGGGTGAPVWEESSAGEWGVKWRQIPAGGWSSVIGDRAWGKRVSGGSGVRMRLGEGTGTSA